MKTRIYLSGKMTGLTREEVMYRFAKAEMELRHQTGATIVNPCRVWAFRCPRFYHIMEWLFGKSNAYTLVLLYDLWLLSRCQRVHLIGPDWQTSRGAVTEAHFAQAARMMVTMEIYDKNRKKK